MGVLAPLPGAHDVSFRMRACPDSHTFTLQVPVGALYARGTASDTANCRSTYYPGSSDFSMGMVMPNGTSRGDAPHFNVTDTCLDGCYGTGAWLRRTHCTPGFVDGCVRIACLRDALVATVATTDDVTKCTVSNMPNEKPFSFSKNSIIGCYCMQQLTALIQANGVVAGAQALATTEGDLCTTFAQAFLAGTSLIVGSSGERWVTATSASSTAVPHCERAHWRMTCACAVLVVVINSVMLVAMKALGKFERHLSVTDEQASTAFKVCFGWVEVLVDPVGASPRLLPL